MVGGTLCYQQYYDLHPLVGL